MPLTRDGEYFVGTWRGGRAGARYRYRLDDDVTLYPDPYSRFQPEGPHGPSEVIDASTFAWSDAEFVGAALEGQVIYEMHVGTFTREGTWSAAAERLDALRDLGITTIEVMPVAEFPGRFGWGYDGVNFFAPTRLYGRPDDFRAFVNRAHAAGIAVILDVVYNHAGPDGNYLRCFAPGYFTDRYANDWGDAINYDGPDASGTRELVVANARYWIREFHLDGLRLDATQCIYDTSEEHILARVVDAARAEASPKSIVIVAENEPQYSALVRPRSEGGIGIDALWNDDFHHSAMVALSGRSEAYYTDYRGTAHELLAALKHGYLYQGQRYAWQKDRRGTSSTGISPRAFVTYLENHDQVANTADGARMFEAASADRVRAITALMLLAPSTPMLFQGQEFGSTAPFLYFADLTESDADLAQKVAAGRSEFLKQFPSVTSYQASKSIATPHDETTFTRSKLDDRERALNTHWIDLHKDLLALRKNDSVLARPRSFDGAVLGDDALVLRFGGERGDERLLVVNLGRDLRAPSLAEPLLAPSARPRRAGEKRHPLAGHEARATWKPIWSSEDPKYRGRGTPALESEAGFCILGHAAVLFTSARGDEQAHGVQEEKAP